MARVTFSDVSIRALKVPVDKERVVFWAEGHPGLGVRVGRGGKKTFISKLDFKGRDHTITHGQYPEVTVRDAIQLHLKFQEQIEHGRDISRTAQTYHGKKVAALAEEYFKLRKTLGKSGYRNEESIFAMDVLPAIGTKSPRDVTSAEIQQLLLASLDRLREKFPQRDRAGQSHVKHMHVALRGFFRWLKEIKVVDANPAEDISTIGSDQARERVLSNVEIWTFWRWIDVSDCGPSIRNALRFALVTGQRSSELRGLKWGHIDESERFWNIGGAKAKNKKFHRVALNMMALAILKAQKGDSKKSPDDFVFDGGSKAGGLGEGTLAGTLERNSGQIGTKPFTPHDLRRTAATLITSLGLPHFYASLLLNHSLPGVTSKVYVQYSYDQEKRKAMEVLDLALGAIVAAKDEKAVPTIEKLRLLVKRKGLL